MRWRVIENQMSISHLHYSGRAEMEDYHIDIRLLQFLFSVNFRFQLDVLKTKVHKMNLCNWREIHTWCNNLFIIINNSTRFGHLYAHLQEY